MRLNGTYIDRLMFNILPIIVVAMTFVYFIKQASLKSTCIAAFLFILFFWAVDSYVIYRRHPKSLRIDHGLLIDRSKVSVTDIVDIRKVTYKPGRFWTWDYFIFSIKEGSALKTINIIEKPQTLIEIILGRKSKTLTPLFVHFPELKEKFTHHTIIHSFR